METTEDVLAGVGPRLRRLRQERNVTLAALADTTGISVSTLSRLESGKRRPSLELLLPLAQAHQVPLDELVGAPNVGDPRIRPRPQRMNDMIVLPLTRRPGGVQAFKMIIPERLPEPDPRVHEGYEWLYVLNGGSASTWPDATWSWSRGGRGVRHPAAALVRRRRRDRRGAQPVRAAGERLHLRARPRQS